MGNNFRLDRTKFSKMSFAEADKEISNSKLNPPKEKLEIAYRLIAIAYNFHVNTPPHMEKTFFEARSLQNWKHI